MRERRERKGANRKVEEKTFARNPTAIRLQQAEYTSIDDDDYTSSTSLGSSSGLCLIKLRRGKNNFSLSSPSLSAIPFNSSHFIQVQDSHFSGSNTCCHRVVKGVSEGVFKRVFARESFPKSLPLVPRRPRLYKRRI